MFGPVHAQFFDLCNGLQCETCLHLVQTKWDEGSAVFSFSSSAVFKNEKVQKIYEVVFAEVGKSTTLPKWITRF